MTPGIFKLVKKTIRFYRKPLLYQVLIIVLLSAVITGSLLTGSSVRSSLKRSSSQKLGNTGIVISSGTRYFRLSLSERMKDSIGIKSTGIIYLNGYCQSINTQKKAFKTQITGIGNDYFKFQGNDSLILKKGEIYINKRLADYLDAKVGDDISVHYTEISDFPAGAPFAPGKEDMPSKVFRVSKILDNVRDGNFSLSISQITPMNVFVRLDDIEDYNEGDIRINRILIDEGENKSITDVSAIIQRIMIPSDIGLHVRKVNREKQYELISDRIFIDSVMLGDIQSILPGSYPVITYLGNRFVNGLKITPYSFIAALPFSLYPEISTGNRMVINRWMADDLDAEPGDTLRMFWYSPDSLNNLVERSDKFIVDRIEDMKGIWSDSLLLPSFPGISGSESCSDWDAGVPINMKLIRQKDEDYWYKYRGTPKAFISYREGKELWGNNFGPATAIRFKDNISSKDILDGLKGFLDPARTGFVITDMKRQAVEAAEQSVDFSSLFLSLGFFLLVAAVVLLSFAVSDYFSSRKNHIRTMYALGFRSINIRRILFTEYGLIAAAGSFAGSLAGILVNMLIINALNSVWKGAVQTDTLNAWFHMAPVITGFLISLGVIAIFIFVKVSRYLKMLNSKEEDKNKLPLVSSNRLLLIFSFSLTIILFILSETAKAHEMMYSFATGTMLLVSLILFWRQHYILNPVIRVRQIKKRDGLSRLYFTQYPSHAVTPILFIAAGVFAVFITGANRMNFTGKYLERSSGTGGYLLWCETAIPVGDDLNSQSARKEYGLDGEQLKDLDFIQAKVSSGNDASCLNLNHIVAPPLLGIDPGDFIRNGAFSFAKDIKGKSEDNPWSYLNRTAGNNIIYGIADQTVLEWGLKRKVGDTLSLKAENGQSLKVILAAGLQSSVFQGYVLIGMENFSKYFPSVSGSTVMLAEGDPSLIDVYKKDIEDRLENTGVEVQKTTDRLAGFYEVTNTYLTVFGVFGAFGMIIAIAGLGFVLLRNYNQRKRDFSLMLATGFTFKRIKKMIFTEQIVILVAGLSSGIISAFVATLPSLRERADIPWGFLSWMITGVLLTGIVALYLSVRSISRDTLTTGLKAE
jgi:putative ABC transport system permease protein